MTETSESCESLRERKTRQTRQAIHTAAVRLAHDQGFEAATIAQIAEAADISERTFFNYYASKEDAVVGVPLVNHDSAEIREIVAAAEFSDDLVASTAEVLTTIAARSPGGPGTKAMRRTVLLRHPGLLSQRTVGESRIFVALHEALHERLEPRLAELDLPEGCSTTDAARLLVLIAMVPLRGAPHVGPDTDDPPESEAAVARLDRSLALFHTLLEASRP